MIRIFFLLLTQVTLAADLVKDLKGEWLAYENEQYIRASAAENPTSTIYFKLSSRTYRGHRLSVRGSSKWDLFINGQLVFTGMNRRFELDSLAERYGDQLFIGVHTSAGTADLETLIVSKNSIAVTGLQEPREKPPFHFRDYAILAVALLLLFFLALFRSNPQLTIDYFSFGKIFSVQERNERLLASRITSSVNLLFYLFCALLTGFLLSNVFHFAGPAFGVSKSMSNYSLGGAFLDWIRLSLYILLLLAAKLLIVLMFSSLFNFRDTISFQFFNFLRFILFTAVMMAALSLGYFMWGGGSSFFYEWLIVLALILLSMGTVMVLVKLLARAPFSFFHLFSYLCASEIIPLVVIIKIFF